MIFLYFVIYSLVIFVSTLLGAFVGLGGGVIIKPVLDFIGFHTLAQIAFFSSAAVFSMSVTSTVKHLKNKTPINMKTVLLFALGSVFGGILGNRLFHYALSVSSSPESVKGIQSAVLAVFLALVILSVNVKIKHYQIKNPAAIAFTGLFLGLCAAFLGIGGGPINVAVLTVLFSFSMRDAAVYSVAIVLFSQLSNLVTIFINTGFKDYDIKYLAVIIPFAILGGFFGAKLNRKCSEKTIRIVFSLAVSSVVCLSAYNAVTAFIK